MSISSPTPAVLHLFTVFRQINAGELRIPAFQREFVWKDSQVLELLASVRDQFPIGSVLLWHVDEKILEIASHKVTSFPQLPERYPASYILDGMQRLSTLFGVFHFGEEMDGRFDVLYDLRRRRFYHRKDGDLSWEAHSVALADLVVPRRMLECQARLSPLADGEALLDELLAMQGAFQDYMIPVVTIRSNDVDRVVGIFEKTNSTGTRLDTVDFMRAITWNREFDLNRYLDMTKARLEERGFELEDETIIKCVGLLMGVSPTSNGLLTLRTQTPDNLKSAFNAFPEHLHRVTEFLKSRFHIHNTSFVPYEGQLLVLFKAIGMEEAESDKERDLLARWFWASGFNESLRGKPDHYVVRAVEDWRGLINGQIRGLEVRLKVSPTDFRERRFIKGKALSAAFASMFVVHGACDLISGQAILPENFMAQPDPKSFVSIFNMDELKAAGIDVGPSPKVFANIAACGQDYGVDSLASYVQLLAIKGDDAVLSSQFFDREMVELIRMRDVSAFLDARAPKLYDAAEALVGGYLDIL